MTTTRSTVTLEFDEQGHATLDFGEWNQGWREPICPECGQPIRWVLDMYSATTGHFHTLVHARCTWTSEAFTKQRTLARKREQ